MNSEIDKIDIGKWSQQQILNEIWPKSFQYNLTKICLFRNLVVFQSLEQIMRYQNFGINKWAGFKHGIIMCNFIAKLKHQIKFKFKQLKRS